MMKKEMMGLILALSLLTAGNIVRAAESEEEAAGLASGKWLTLVDKGQYGQSWSQASRYFKNSVKKGQWQAQVSAARSPFGKVVERKLKSAVPAKSLPGAPDGEYVVIQYNTAFEKKRAAVETVTPVKEEDGQWRISGYFIK